jgi:hypothetical protein
MLKRENNSQVSYYRREASACAAAATSAVIAEVRNAYHELELGWLSLAPKAERTLEVAPGAPQIHAKKSGDPAN